MDLFGILIWLVVLVSLTVFIIAVVKGFKGWGVSHTVLLTILFLEAWTFLFFTAGVASRRLGYHKAYFLIEKKVAEQEKNLSLETIGDRSDPSLNLERYLPLVNELNRVQFERGRVWRGSTVNQASATGATLQLALQQAPAANAPAPAPAAAAAEPAPPQDGGLPVKSIVYAFGEKVLDRVGIVPSVYLGEYVVTESNGGVIKVVPTAPLDEEQINAIKAGNNTTWAIYEVIPLDSHTAFASPSSKPEDNAIFGYMDPQEISALLGIDLNLAQAVPSSLGIKEGIKASVLQSYLNDGGRAPDGTPAEALGKRVEFLVEHKVDDIDDEKENSVATKGGFFRLGKTVDARLKRTAEDGAAVVFKPGQTYVFDLDTADRLIEQKIAKLIDPVFIRPLNDYEYAFREVRRRTVAAQQESLLIKREIAEVNRSIGVADEQIIARQEERKKLDKDFAQYKKELDVVNDAAEKLAGEVTETREKLTTLYSTIHLLHSKLVTTQQALADAINAATAP